jgi:hypothetical protein
MEEIKQLINKKLKDNKEEIDSLNKKLKEQLLIKKELSKQLTLYGVGICSRCESHTLESLEDVYCVNCDYEKKMTGY